MITCISWFRHRPVDGLLPAINIMVSRRLYLWTSLIAFFLRVVIAHKHHDELTEEEANAPVDAMLWIHIFLQVMVWGILFPIGMVLGISRSRWHVPLQVRFQILFITHFWLKDGVCRVLALHWHWQVTFWATHTRGGCFCLLCMAILPRFCLCQYSHNWFWESTSNYTFTKELSDHLPLPHMEFLEEYIRSSAGRRWCLVSWRSGGIVVEEHWVGTCRGYFPVNFVQVYRRTMPCALSDGQRIHCVWLHSGNYVTCRGSMGKAQRTQSRMVGFLVSCYSISKNINSQVSRVIMTWVSDIIFCAHISSGPVSRASVSRSFANRTLTYHRSCVVNTFTEHHGSTWSVKDMQHT